MALLQVIPIMANLKPMRVNKIAQKGLERELAKLKAKRTLACLRVLVSYLMRRFLKLELRK